MVNSGCSVLLYHRVESLRRDPFALAVSPQRFNDQLAHLKSRCDVISLRDLVQRLRDRSSISGCAVITFDDGYADNLWHAKPILEKHGIPATIFVTAGMVESKREFWWDEVERLFLGSHPLPEVLKLRALGREHRWEIQDRAPTESTFKEVHRLLRGMTPPERDNALAALFSWAGLDRDAARATHRILNHLELETLSRHELIEIGSHALTHTSLATLPRSDLRVEVEVSRLELQKMTGSDITSFSYPFGLKQDMSRKAYRAVKKSGYCCAVTNLQGSVRPDSDPFLLPRRIVRNWTAEELGSRLADS